MRVNLPQPYPQNEDRGRDEEMSAMSLSKDITRPLSELDGPRGLPFAGNLFQIRFEKLHEILEEWAGRYGTVYRIRMGPKPAVVIADADATRKIMVERPHLYRRPGALQRVTEEMNLLGVFSEEGEAWKRQRRVVVRALNYANVTSFFPRLQTAVDRLQKRWEQAAELGSEVNLCDDLMRFTVDTSAWLAFGIDFNTMETSGPVIQQNLNKVFPKLQSRINLPFPYWHYLRLPSDRALDRALEAIEEQTMVVIEETRERLAANPELRSSPTNFLEAVIAGQDEEEAGFSDTEILANVGTLLLAGEDTTANSMAWMIEYFIQYPDHFRRACEEVDSVIAPALTVRSSEHMDSFPFIDAFCNESMRLKPIAPLFTAAPCEEVEILGYRIPEGTPIFMLTRLMAQQDENFGDGRNFDPDRWLVAPGDRDYPHNLKAFSPFGVGPRLCPGRAFALLQIRMVMAMLCRNFDVERASPSRPVTERLTFSMGPDGAIVRFRKRNV